MKVESSVTINSSKEKIWEIISSIENSVQTIKGIEKIEILHQPNEGVIGLKWIETRTMFGKTAKETMEITHAEPYVFYQTKAENHGALYISRLRITELGDEACILKMDFESRGQTILAKLLSGLFGLLLKGMTRKMLDQDLLDIKEAAEHKN